MSSPDPSPAPSASRSRSGARVEVDPHNPRARDMLERLEPLGVFEALPAEVCVVVGGDGFMLRTIRERGPGHVYLGLNAGHLGFLLNDVTDPAAVAAAVSQSAWTISSFPRLRLTAWRADDTELSALAVNDLYIERATGQTAHLEMRIGGNVVVERLICDGVLASTALGSTAYSYSAGGVPCHPQVPALLVTPIAPHVPRLTPMMLPLDAIVEVSALDTHRRPVRAVADGVDLGEVVRMRVEDSHDNVRLAFFEGHNFTRALVRKVLRA